MFTDFNWLLIQIIRVGVYVFSIRTGEKTLSQLNTQTVTDVQSIARYHHTPSSLDFSCGK